MRLSTTQCRVIVLSRNATAWRCFVSLRTLTNVALKCVLLLETIDDCSLFQGSRECMVDLCSYRVVETDLVHRLQRIAVGPTGKWIKSC